VEADRLAAPHELLLPLDMLLLLYVSALETSLPCCVPREVLLSSAADRCREPSLRGLLLGLMRLCMVAIVLLEEERFGVATPRAP
jgi:hypothetical protein